MLEFPFSHSEEIPYKGRKAGPSNPGTRGSTTIGSRNATSPCQLALSLHPPETLTKPRAQCRSREEDGHSHKANPLARPGPRGFQERERRAWTSLSTARAVKWAQPHLGLHCKREETPPGRQGQSANAGDPRVPGPTGQTGPKAEEPQPHS